jgi:hypothetical protein
MKPKESAWSGIATGKQSIPPATSPNNNHLRKIYSSSSAGHD